MKAVIQFGYKEYVMDAEKALTLLGLMEGAERYEEKYRGGDTPTTLHIYEESNSENYKMLKLVNEKTYKLAKLAGKPEEK